MTNNKIKLFLLSLGLLNMTAQYSFAKPHAYTDGKNKFLGEYFEVPNSKKAPGVVVVHNWKGVSDETRKQTERFQKLGYNVFAADIYGEGVRPQDPKAAGAEAGKYKSDRKLLRERVNLAIAELKKMPNVDKEKIVVLGYCFGGTAAIESARSGENLKGVISFHGGLDSPEPALGAQIKAKVLALHGADDPYVAAKDLEAFESEMKAHKVKYELVKYPGAVHSFTEEGAGNDNSKGAAYNKDADQKSFEKAKAFLKSAF